MAENNKPRLGEILIEQDMISEETLTQALRLQVGRRKLLGEILVQMKVITDEQLAETLESKLGIPILDIQNCSLVEAKKELPRYLCRQYGVLPLRIQQNNVLELAMANPSDLDAVNDIEHYTGRVVEARLARHSEIDRAISRCIPFGIKDLFSPQASTMMTRTVAAFALLCVLGLAGYTFDYIRKSREGTVSVTADFTLYNNHDLTVAVDKQGRYSLQGHGAFADGLYKVEFSQIQHLRSFIEKREKDFSEKQRTWLSWALQKAEKNTTRQMVAKK